MAAMPRFPTHRYGQRITERLVVLDRMLGDELHLSSTIVRERLSIMVREGMSREQAYDALVNA